MNANIKIFLLCPIPENQKPINEYLSLKENKLNEWNLLNQKEYQKFLLIFFLSSFFLISFFNPINLNLLKINFFSWFNLQSLLSINFTLIFLFISLLRLYDIEKRFQEARLFYEESSWYDGQIWEKPFLLIKNDQLLISQKLQPLIQRLSKTILFFILIDIYFILKIMTII